MGIILDIIVIAIILFSTIIGYRRGFINLIFNLCALIVSLIITFFLYTPITNFIINNTEFDNKIESMIIQNGITTTDVNGNEDNVTDKYIMQSITETKNGIVESTSSIIAQKIIGILVALALFIVVRIFLTFAKALVSGFASLPIIKQLNEIGGFAYGILMGFVFVYVILATIFFILSINNASALENAINSSFITKFLYSNNIILNIIF